MSATAYPTWSGVTGELGEQVEEWLADAAMGLKSQRREVVSALFGRGKVFPIFFSATCGKGSSWFAEGNQQPCGCAGIDHRDVSFPGFSSKVKDNIGFLSCASMLQGKAFVLLCGDDVLTCECDKAVLQHIMSLQLSGVAMHGMLEAKDAVAGTKPG